MSLKRALGPFDATMVVIGGIIGTGIFVNPCIVARVLDLSPLVLGRLGDRRAGRDRRRVRVCRARPAAAAGRRPVYTCATRGIRRSDSSTAGRSSS